MKGEKYIYDMLLIVIAMLTLMAVGLISHSFYLDTHFNTIETKLQTIERAAK